MTAARFRNRTEAGRLLAKKLARYANRPDVLVLALPRGGVPVGFEIAKALHAPLDLFLVRKLGVPGHKELAMGAIASNGAQIINNDIVYVLGLSDAEIQRVIAQERRELERRERLYRHGLPTPEISARTVILVDDGIATGATIRLAINVLKKQRPAGLIVAVPVAPPSTCRELREELEIEVVCLLLREPFGAISLWYDNFSQISDEEVCELLGQASRDVSISCELQAR